MSNAPDPTRIAVGVDQDTTTGTIGVDAGGRPIMAGGLRQYYQRLARLLAADEILGSPGVGAGLAALIGEPLTPQIEQTALAQAQAAILADPLTASLTSLSISMPDMATIHLSATIVIVGSAAAIPLVWTVTQ